MISNNTIKVNPHSQMSGVEGIFSGGDVVSGPATVIEAIAAGRKAGIATDKYLSGQSLDFEIPNVDTIDIDNLDITGVKKRKRQKMSALPPKKRIQGFKEVEIGFDELAALREADRCLQCGMFPKK